MPGGDESIKFWDLTTKRMYTQYVGSLECGHLFKKLIENEQILLSISFDCTIKVWELLQKGACLFTINAHSDWIGGREGGSGS